MASVEIMNSKKIRIMPKGYPSFRCVVNGKMRTFYCHVVVWESVNGKKPTGFDIHHIDNNKLNYNIDNLLLVKKEDHKKIHKGWIMENGLWVAKPCSFCKKIYNILDFKKYKHGKCDFCYKEYRKKMVKKWQQ